MKRNDECSKKTATGRNSRRNVVISFKGMRYPARIVTFRDFGERLVSVESLEDAIFSDEYPVNLEAQKVDESIFFYVPDDIFTESDEDVSGYVERNVA